MPQTATEPGTLNGDINVLPLIDVLLVLIIVAIVMLSAIRFIPARLPQPETSGKELGPSPQIVLELRRDGSLTINSQPIPEAMLETQIQAIYRDRPVKLLFIKASDDRSYQEVVTLMDRARGAGIQVLALMPRSGS